ncbi:MAG: polysaccharide biosynthesis tyrosine autokinase [Kovacikia sp.]
MNEMPLLPIVIKRNFWNALAAFASAIGASLVYLVITQPLYQASSRLILDERRTSVSELGRNLAAAPVPGNANPIATQAELVTSKQLIVRSLSLIQNVDRVQKPLPTADDVKGRLQVKILPATNILEVIYQNPNPRMAAEVVNAIARATVQESGESIRREAFSVRQFIESQIPQQEGKLQRAEAEESRFKASRGIISIDTQSNSLVASLTTIEDQERTLIAQLQESQLKNKRLQRVTGVDGVESAYISSRVGQDEELKDLRRRLSEMDAQVADKSSRLADQNPEMLDLIQKRDETRALYMQKLARVNPRNQAISGTMASDDLSRNLMATYITGEVDRSAMSEKLKALENQRRSLQASIAQLPTVQRILNTLVRRRETEAEALKVLKNNLEQARIAEAQLVSNVRIIGLATPPLAPNSPQPRSILLLGAAFGFISAICVVLLGEMLRNTVGSAREAETQLKLPVLSTLPRLSPELDQELLESFLDNSIAIEPYRKLIKTLETNSDNKLQAILLSSIVDEEGKSNVAARLASVSAMLSRRTLLIDADLNRPLQQSFFNLPAIPGLIDVVNGGVPLLSAVKSTRIPNLDVLTTGQWLKRPAQILEATAMQTLLKEAKNIYDLVIIDTSAVSLYSDVITLSQQTNGLVLVVRPEITPKAIALQTIAELNGCGTKILGMVINETPDSVRMHSPNLISEPINLDRIITESHSERPLEKT